MAGLNASTGQAALSPLQLSATSQSPAAARHSTVAALNASVGHAAAVPDPSGVDTAAVAKELPYGTVNVTAVKGGLEVPAESGNDSILIANAAVIVSFDDDKTG